MYEMKRKNSTDSFVSPLRTLLAFSACAANAARSGISVGVADFKHETPSIGASDRSRFRFHLCSFGLGDRRVHSSPEKVAIVGVGSRRPRC